MNTTKKLIIILGALIFLISCETTETKNKLKETSIEETSTITPSDTSIPSLETENETIPTENTTTDTLDESSNTIENSVTPNSNIPNTKKE